MPSNQQRREAAKRKLERQLVRRQERSKIRRQRLLIGGVVIAVLAIGGVVSYVTLHKSTPAASSTDGTSSDASSAPSSAAPVTPCTYTTTDVAKSVKDVKAPENTSPANVGNVDVTITMNGQPVGITLNRKLAPCGVNSFLSLASQGFYNSTDCWRLTASEQLNILQCGDPSGKGNGGPGYTFADENATATDFPVGTLAYANSGSGTNGSQFFIVYGKTHLASAGYSVIGTVSSEGMKVVQDIAAKGVTGGTQTGVPIQKATITSVSVPDGATTAIGNYSSASASPGGPPTEGSTPVPSDSSPAQSSTAPASSSAAVSSAG